MWLITQGVFCFLEVQVQCVLLPIVAKWLSVSKAEPPTVFADTLLLVSVHQSFSAIWIQCHPFSFNLPVAQKKNLKIHELFSYLSSKRHSDVSQVVSTFLFSGGFNGIHSLINAI